MVKESNDISPTQTCHPVKAVFGFLGPMCNVGLIAIVDVGPVGHVTEALYPDPVGLTSSAYVATGRKTSFRLIVVLS